MPDRPASPSPTGGSGPAPSVPSGHLPCCGEDRRGARAARSGRWERSGNWRLRAVAALALVAFCAALLPACGPKERDPNTVEFWTLQLSPAFDDYFRPLIARYEAEHPGITIRWVDVPYEGITQKYLNAIAAGQAPDVVNLPADYVLKYARLGALARLDTLLDAPTLGTYLPSAMAPLIVDVSGSPGAGRAVDGAPAAPALSPTGPYGVPWYLSTQVLIYDRAKLAAVGIDSASVPTTFDGLLDFADAYHRKTGDYAFFYNLVAESDLVMVLQAEGIPIVTPDGRRAAFDTPEAAAILERWRETFRAGAMPRESLTQGHAAAMKLYQSGTIALFVGGPQFLRIVRENAPSLYATTAVAPALTGRSGARNLAVMSLAVSRKSANARAAADFAAFVTNAANQLAFARRVPVYPSVTTALDDPFFRIPDTTGTGAGPLEAQARVVGASQLAGARSLKPSLPNYNRLQEALKVELLRAFKDGKPIREALHDAATDWNMILAEGR